MRLEQLTYMVEIAKTHSFSLAAENLFISQSTLSEAIKKLEAELSVALFTRAKNGVYLTDAGQEILDIALQMLRLSDQIKTVARQANPVAASNMRGELDISVSVGIIQEYLERMLPIFQKRYPHIVLNIIERSFYTLLGLIQNGQSDLGITATDHSDHWLDNASDLLYKCIDVDDFYALVSAASPLAQRNSLSISDLLKHPIATIGFNEARDVLSGHPLNEMLSETAQFQIVFTTNNLQLFLNYLLQNKTVIGFPISKLTLAALPKTPQLTAVRINDTFKAKIYYLYRADSPKLPLIEAFLDTLQKNIL